MSNKDGSVDKDAWRASAGKGGCALIFVGGMGAPGKTQGAWLLPLEGMSANVQENNPAQRMSCYSPVVSKPSTEQPRVPAEKIYCVCSKGV